MADAKIGVAGCAGRMGMTLVREVAATPGCVLAGGFEVPGHAAIGRDIGDLAGAGQAGLNVSDTPESVFAVADIVLDFTLPAATSAHAALAAQSGTGLVIGTTGLEAAQLGAIEAAAKKCAIVQAANMSVGVNLLLRLARDVAGILDPAYDIEIVEMHHRHKVDAPSGTALALGSAAAEGRGVALDEAAVRGRDGITGARAPGAGVPEVIDGSDGGRGGDVVGDHSVVGGTIGFAALRGGDVVGDHSVVFAADGERIELTHKASSRQVFSRGAVRAALWLHGKPPGLYRMDHVLGFEN